MAGNGAARVFDLLATIVRTVCSVIAAVIVLHTVFVLFEANPANPLVTSTAGWRDTSGWFPEDLFTPSDPKIAETFNDALAALIWVVVGNLVAKVIARFAPPAEAGLRRSWNIRPLPR